MAWGGLFPFNPERVLHHIEITEPLTESTSASALQQAADSIIDPNVFNSSLPTSSSSQLNIDSFHEATVQTA